MSMNKRELMRKKAEEMVLEKFKTAPHHERKSTPENDLKILHELLVHQIELELQNEELRSVQNELYSAKEAYFDLFNLAPTGYISMSETGIVLDANLFALRMFNLNRDNFIKKTFSKFIYKEDLEEYYSFKKRLGDLGKSDSIEIRLLKNADTHFFAQMEARIAKDAEGYRRVFLTFNDISERRSEEEKLKLRELHLTAIIENQPGAIWLKNLDGKFLLVNSIFSKLIGKQSASDIVGLSDFDIFDLEIAEKYLKDDQDAIKTKKQIRRQESDFGQDQITWYETFVRPIFNTANEVIGTTGSRFASFDQK
jgi:PAS domain S-box-containing protein